MRITGVHVDGFGVWSGLDLPELSDQLNVFYGANEAGKTTLMQFVRSILYGFSTERRARYLPPVRPGRPGGMLRIADGQKQSVITRHADQHSETALVDDGHQSVQDEQALADLLGHLDEGIFNNVFAFGLSEIQELGTLSDTQVADELYNIALGMDRVSLVDVLRELDASRNRLLAVDDRPSLVTQLVSQRDRLQSEIDDLGQSTLRYLTLSTDREKLQLFAKDLEAEGARLEQASRELNLARALSDRWQRRTSIDNQLAALGPFQALPPDALTRLDRLGSRLTARRARLRRLKGERRAVVEQVERLNINEALCQAAMRLEALGEQQQWIKSLEAQVQTLEGEVGTLQTERDDAQLKLGLAKTVAGGAAEPVSRRELHELRSAAKALRGARRRIREFEGQIAATQEKAVQQQRKVEGALGSAKQQGLTAALAEAGELVSKLRTRVQLDQRLDQMSRREAELDQQGQEHLEKQILPGWVLASLGAAFVLGCALLLLFLAGLALPESITGSLGWGWGFLGLLTAGLAAATKFALEHGALMQLDSCHEQMQVLAQQIDEAKADRDDLDAQLPRGGGPLVARLQAAEKELTRLEALLPHESDRESAQRDAESARQEQDRLNEDLRRLRSRWRQLLSTAGLPADLAPKDLDDYCSRRDQLAGLNKALEARQQELKGRRGEYDVMTSRIKQLLAEVGVMPSANGPVVQLQQSLMELKEQQLRAKRRAELEGEMARLRRRKSKIMRSIDDLRQRRHTLLRAAGTSDEQEFRRRAQLQVEAQKLQAERTGIAQEIAAALVGHCSETTLAERLADPVGLDQLIAQVADRRTALAIELATVLEKRGEMNEQIKRLVESRQLPHLRIELGTVEKRLQDAMERWRVLTLTMMMLEGVRDYYEREHQPQALREASGYLRKLTGGRYVRVWTPLGEHTLKVDDSEGHALNVQVLSRGTREQLFLALRLALVSAYRRRGAHLPLVLDDVLVNFDVGRAKAAAVVLRDFARQGHQVLVFTCHEHIAKLFKQLKAEVRNLPDNSQPAQLASTEQAVKRARRTRPEIPLEPEPPDEDFDPDFEEDEPESSPAEPPEAVVVVAEAPEPAVAELPPEPPQPAPPPPDFSRPSRTIRADPPEPPPRPTRQLRRGTEYRTERVNWSAEEFEGELADRVRRSYPIEEESTSPDDADAA